MHRIATTARIGPGADRVAAFHEQAIANGWRARHAYGSTSRPRKIAFCLVHLPMQLAITTMIGDYHIFTTSVCLDMDRVE